MHGCTMRQRPRRTGSTLRLAPPVRAPFRSARGWSGLLSLGVTSAFGAPDWHVAVEGGGQVRAQDASVAEVQDGGDWLRDRGQGTRDLVERCYAAFALDAGE